ncbi:hypothetical protein Vretimale_16504 [Volvox reticuliferus]|uniref:Myb-like domain-containing protein n=1 Tax=Volvox reticuliferus TaxID=1737510 RepID=A0A8J4GTV4_9CHLO|nr:hypothetical protein Vretifemale_17570 [Volvox reticuliferus]GIM13449.1 hypothetical protein Vretimale_16504 [Volvox reticuliferus]
MDICPGPAAGATSDTLSYRSSGRLRSRPREFWRNEARPNATASQALDFPDPEARDRRGEYSTHFEPLGVKSRLSRLDRVANASEKVMKRQADLGARAGSLRETYIPLGAATSMPTRRGALAGTAHGCRAQPAAQLQQLVTSEGSHKRPLLAQKQQSGSLPGTWPGEFQVEDAAAAMFMRSDKAMPRAARAATAADQVVTNKQPPAVRPACTHVGNLYGKRMHRKGDYRAMSDVPAVADPLPTTTAAKAAGVVMADVQPAMTREKAEEVQAAGPPAAKSRVRRVRLDPVLRSAIMVRDVAEAVRQVVGHGSDGIWDRSSRRAAADNGAHLVKEQVKQRCTAGSTPRTQNASWIASQDHVRPGASNGHKLATNARAKGKSARGPAAAAATKQRTQQQQQAPAPSLPAAVEPEQDTEEEEASRPRKRSRKSVVQDIRNADSLARATAGMGCESERVPERTPPARVCAQPIAATATEEWLQQDAKEGAATEKVAAVRSQQNRGRPKGASPTGIGIAAQPTSQREANIAPQLAAPGETAGTIQDAGPGKAVGQAEALGNAPSQIHEPGEGHRQSPMTSEDGEMLWQTSGKVTREKQSTHGISQQPDTAQATEAADRSGDGIPQETGRTAEDRARDVAAVPSQHTRHTPPTAGVDASYEADGGPSCRHAQPHAVMHAQHELQPKCGPSVPGLAPASSLLSKVKSIRRALHLVDELKKQPVKWQQAIVDCEEDGWTPEQVRDLQMAYYRTDPTLPNFWREVARGVRGRTAAECFSRVFGSAQDREDRALFAKVLRRYHPASAAESSACWPLAMAAARKRSQKAHEQDLLERIARLECIDDDSKPDVENRAHVSGSCASEPAGDKCRKTGMEAWEHHLHGKETIPSAPHADSSANGVEPAVNVDWFHDTPMQLNGSVYSEDTMREQQEEWQEDDAYDEYSTEELAEDEDQDWWMLLQ